MRKLVERSLLCLALAAGAPLSAGCAAARPDVPRPPGELDLRALEGTWYVLESTFPMWLEGEKEDPAFHYRIITSVEGGLLLDDRVTYLEDGQEESIEGIDTPDPRDPTHFTWRGKGILRLFASDWHVVMRAPDDRWAVIYFSATLATPEGLDIIARTKGLPEATLAEIRAAISAERGLRQLAAGLRPVKRRR